MCLVEHQTVDWRTRLAYRTPDVLVVGMPPLEIAMYTPEQRDAIRALGQHLYERAWGEYLIAYRRKSHKVIALYDLALEPLHACGCETVGAAPDDPLVLRPIPEVNDRDPWQHETRPK
jgi:hypothetical protein